MSERVVLRNCIAYDQSPKTVSEAERDYLLAEVERLRREYVATTPCRDPIEVDDVGEDKPCGECEPCKARALAVKGVGGE